jgi:2'-5' RNA ligase
LDPGDGAKASKLTMSGSDKRLFIGMGFSEQFARDVEPWVKKIKKTADHKETSLRWIPTTNYHVTLVFLGNTHNEDIPQIETTMAEVASRHSPFNIKIRDISAFPTLTQARVIYLGVQRSQNLLDLQSDLESALLPPEKSERDYSPHLTLARLRNPKSCRDLLSPFSHVDLGKQRVSSILLFNSVLANGYPVYERLSQFELINKPDQ